MTKGIQLLKPKIVKILKKYGVLRAGIFGSYARGEEKKKSDVDVLVKLKKNQSLFDFIGIKLDLEKELHCKVDLVEYEALRPELKRRILHDEVRVL